MWKTAACFYKLLFLLRFPTIRAQKLTAGAAMPQPALQNPDFV
jgi:hypothetical protein